MSKTYLVYRILMLGVFCTIMPLYSQGWYEDPPLLEPEAEIKELLPSSGQLDTDFLVSRDSGVAPLSVHFTAGYKTEIDGMGSFHTFEYQWIFDDPESGLWGTSGLNRNYAYGPVASYIFQKPGNYNVKLLVKDKKGELVREETHLINVKDPNVVFKGDRTICVSDNRDFSGAPAGARKITTGNLNEITPLVKPGTRVLFRRGGEWQSNGLDFPDNEGPVHLGAFGEGVNPNKQGHFENAPLISFSDGSFCNLENKQDWRFTDIHIYNESRRAPDGFGGQSNMQRILIYNMEVEGFYIGVGWTHWNTEELLPIDQMVVANSYLHDSQINCLYGGAERMALLGNIIEDSRESHVARVWQAYRGVISHNIISGSSLDSDDGRHALKLHGPGDSIYEANELGQPVPESPLLENYSEEIVVSNNLFGSSGPWPVIIGPQDRATETKMYNILFENNKIITQYGKENSMNVSIALSFFASCSTIRNNIFDGTGSNQDDYMGIRVGGDQVIPVSNIDIYNNTVYRKDNKLGDTRFGFSVGNDSSNINILNNIVSFPKSKAYTLTVEGECENLKLMGNMLVEDNIFPDPDNKTPLLREFLIEDGNKKGIYKEFQYKY